MLCVIVVSFCLCNDYVCWAARTQAVAAANNGVVVASQQDKDVDRFFLEAHTVQAGYLG